MTRSFSFDAIPDTVDSVTGTVPLSLDPLPENTSFLSSYKILETPVHFKVTPYVPDIKGTLNRQGTHLGTVPLDFNHVLPKHRNHIYQGLIHSISCYTDSETLLKQWQFGIPHEQEHFILHEDEVKEQWHMRLTNRSLEGKNLVPLIPIGGRWDTFKGFDGLRQIYGFLTTQQDQKPFWYLIDDLELAELGIYAPQGGYCKSQFFLPLLSHTPLHPTLKDITLTTSIGDLEWTHHARRMSRINPQSLCTTLYFQDHHDF
jgi:hypothetical protein